MHRIKSIAITTPLLILAILVGLFFYLSKPKTMLLAPMIGGLDSCLFRKEKLKYDSPNSKFTRLCLQDQQSASQLVEATLAVIAGSDATETKYRLGYTLYIPLLKLFEKVNGKFEINNKYIDRVVNTIKNTNKPVILYFFSNHFEVGSSLEKELAGNPENMLETKQGTLSKDKYYGSIIYPWSFVDLENDITHLREVAFGALLNRVCKLPVDAISLIEGVTVLGELHHMFPDFQGGMGFDGNYYSTDYSSNSISGFREFLSKKYSSITALNKQLDSNFSSFDKIFPPSKNIRSEPLNNYFEHIDAYAQGTFPITGWVGHKSRHGSVIDWIRIYGNGQFLARVPVNYSRQDVVVAHPELNSADVGWRYDFSFSKAEPGIYDFDIFLEQEAGLMVRLASRQVAIMKRNQEKPTKLIAKIGPDFVLPSDDILFNVDLPLAQSSYYYNPMVVLWNEFRNSQINNYLSHFYDIASHKCINPALIYSHQILPFVNPGWDETKYAAGRDLAVPRRMALGVSLYGEASYGNSFKQWYKGTGRKYYGVTEFHPLKPMSPSELGSVLREHDRNHAKFVSFFVNSVGLEEDPAYKSNLFSFDLNNKNAGSDVLYSSVKSILVAQP